MSRFKFFKRGKDRTFRNHGQSDEEHPIESKTHESYFGETLESEKGSEHGHPRKGRKSGEQILLRFIKSKLGSQCDNLTLRLMNKNPLQDGSSFTYNINQTTEESDMQIIVRDLLSGRLYRSGTKLIAATWAYLLFGDKFENTSSRKHVHELTYTRTSCTCISCLVRAKSAENGEVPCEDESHSFTSNGSSTYTPENSAMANFVRPYLLPTKDQLKHLTVEGHGLWRELEIGAIMRLNSRSSAKLHFTEDVKKLFSHMCYTGPLSHELVYRKVTTIGVNYYLYNKGKKERKVYLQGELLQIPLEMGVVKLASSPLRMDELGAYYILYRRQTIDIYAGELVLEGNSIGSFIPTGIKFYLGVGEEGGCAAVYPNMRLGKPRHLGINELLLHHHMVDDLRVRIR